MSEVKCAICGRVYEEDKSKEDIYPKKCQKDDCSSEIKNTPPKKIINKKSKTSIQADEVSYQADKVSYQKVDVVNFDMSFINMVIFMVKWVIASIPAIIILFFIFVIINIITTGMGIGILSMFK